MEESATGEQPVTMLPHVATIRQSAAATKERFDQTIWLISVDQLICIWLIHVNSTISG
jgi:hypothetical protein